MKIETIQPRQALTKYIDFYYFIKESSPDFKSIHFSFPHTSNTVSIYKNADIRSTLGTVEIFHDDDRHHLTILQKKRQMPLKVELSGVMDRITIFFKPLGINAFIDSPLYSLMFGSDLFDWEKNPAYHEMLEQFFSLYDLQKRTDILENFLIGILKDNTNPVMERSISMLTDHTREYLVEDICREVELPVRTFTRKFRNATGVSPTEYRRIARFRHSLENGLIKEGFKRLTDVAYTSNFFDQSYFNKIYRQMTGLNPRAFFEEVSKLGNDKLIFNFMNK